MFFYQLQFIAIDAARLDSCSHNNSNTKPSFLEVLFFCRIHMFVFFKARSAASCNGLNWVWRFVVPPVKREWFWGPEFDSSPGEQFQPKRRSNPSFLSQHLLQHCKILRKLISSAFEQPNIRPSFSAPQLPKFQKDNDKRGAAEVTRDGSSIIQFFWESVRTDSIGRRGKLLKTGRVDDLSKIWFVENMIFWKDDLSKTWFVEKILRIKDNKSKNDWFKNRFVKKKSHLLLDKHSHWVN